jgi:hypothetical protein
MITFRQFFGDLFSLFSFAHFVNEIKVPASVIGFVQQQQQQQQQQ